ncbi:MAG: nicotinate (nicotinamide) nucleotide adenylyltransferase [Solirubrobacterales bacterium]
MRVGILGGTFNPPHHGHVICAQEARIRLELDEVRLMPTGAPPHRDVDGDPGRRARFNMCRLAVIGQPGLTVEVAEIDRDGPSFTVDTLEQLIADSPETAFTLIIGADQAIAFADWREPERIAQQADIAVAARAGSDYRQALDAVSRASGGKQPLSFEMPEIDLSSSMIRGQVKRGQTVSHMVPAGIAELIEEQGSYQ